MHKSRPTLAEIRRINKRRDRLSTLQENLSIASMMGILIAFPMVGLSAYIHSEVLTWAGTACVFAAPLLVAAALVVDYINN